MQNMDLLSYILKASSYIDKDKQTVSSTSPHLVDTYGITGF